MKNNAMRTAQKVFAGIIESCQPHSIASFGDDALQVANAWKNEHPRCQTHHFTLAQLAQQPPSQTYGLALISRTLELLDKHQGQELIGLLRNYGTRQIAILIKPSATDSSAWQFNDFISMGFKQVELSENNSGDNTQLALYSYSLDSYNHVRTWNNPRFWANPEMWHKARW
ncbi:DUF6231 family protein [Agaribacterium sp. ZY112]|uniref:DUF6231 family protein n=1 Tax=Agaribacterium sp. ZY112 TaxID=3233574 RepID=UPI0035256FE8